MKQAAVTLIINSGLILGVSRRHDKTKFGLPGGKVESHEEPWMAAIRETKEETNIHVMDLDLVFKREEPAATLDGFPFFTFCYYAKTWLGSPRDSEEGIVKWLTLAELIGDFGAFPDYNRRTLDAFKLLYPNVKLIGE